MSTTAFAGRPLSGVGDSAHRNVTFPRQQGRRHHRSPGGQADHPHGPTLLDLHRTGERLYVEFGAAVPYREILAMVRQCRAELDIVPVQALPELVERLARQRLLDRLEPPLPAARP